MPSELNANAERLIWRADGIREILIDRSTGYIVGWVFPRIRQMLTSIKRNEEIVVGTDYYDLRRKSKRPINYEEIQQYDVFFDEKRIGIMNKNVAEIILTDLWNKSK